MYEYIKGIIEEVDADGVVIESNGIGYRLHMNVSYVEGFRLGQETKIYTHLNHKEDTMALYGFPTKEAKNTFLAFNSVGGIGPKTALAIVGYMTVDRLIMAILSGDTKTLSKCPGIGAKTASRIILELRDRFKDASYSSDCDSDDNLSVAVDALIALGYSQSDAYKWAKDAIKAGATTSEEAIFKALAIINKE